jgi:hypothetical protein
LADSDEVEEQTPLDRWRAKYPGAYDDVSDADLAEALVKKWPVYAEPLAQYLRPKYEGQPVPGPGPLRATGMGETKESTPSGMGEAGPEIQSAAEYSARKANQELLQSALYQPESEPTVAEKVGDTLAKLHKVAAGGLAALSGEPIEAMERPVLPESTAGPGLLHGAYETVRGMTSPAAALELGAMPALGETGGAVFTGAMGASGAEHLLQAANMLHEGADPAEVRDVLGRAAVEAAPVAHLAAGGGLSELNQRTAAAWLKAYDEARAGRPAPEAGTGGVPPVVETPEGSARAQRPEDTTLTPEEPVLALSKGNVRGAAVDNLRAALENPRIGPPTETDTAGLADMRRKLEEINSRLSSIGTETSGQKPGLVARFGVGRVKPGAVGTFNQATGEIRSVSPDDIAALSHEVAHHLDRNTDMVSRVLEDPAATAEAEKLSYYVKDGTETPEDMLRLRQEGIAELGRLWFTDPKLAQSMAPNLRTIFENSWDQYDPEGFQKAQAVQGQYQTYVSQSVLGRIGANIVRDIEAPTPPPSSFYGDSKLANWWFRATRTLINKDEVYRQMSNLARASGKPFAASQDPWVLSQLTRNRGDRVRLFLEQGIPDPETMQKLPDVQPLFTIAKSIDPGNRDEFSEYWIGMRHADMMAEGVKPEVVQAFLDGPGGGITANNLVDALADAEKRHPEFQQTLSEIQKWNNAFIDYLVAKGAVTDTIGEAWKQNLYAPMYRLAEHTEGGGPVMPADIRSPFKAIRGSERGDIMDPFVGLMKNVNAGLRAADRASIMQAVIKGSKELFGNESSPIATKVDPTNTAFTTTMEQVRKALIDAGFDESATFMRAGHADLEHLTTKFWTPDLKGSPLEGIVAYQNPAGETELWQLDPELWRATKDQPSPGAADAVQALAAGLMMGSAAAYRLGVVANPGFWLGRTLREGVADYVNTGFLPGVTEAKGLPYSIKSLGGRYEPATFQWRASGGSQAPLGVRGVSGLSEMLARAQGRSESMLEEHLGMTGPAVKILASPFKALIAMSHTLSHIFESTSRLGVFVQQLESDPQGTSTPFNRPFQSDVTPLDRTLRAGAVSRQSRTDFAQRGSSEGFNAFAQTVPFMRPFIQSLWRTGVSAFENPDRFGTASLAQIGMSLGSYISYERGDDKVKQLMDSQPQVLRNMYYLYGYTDGDGKARAFAYPSSWQMALPAKILEKILDNVRTGDDQEAKQMVQLVGQTMVPNLMPTSVLMPVEYALNYSFFLGRSIVPDYLVKAPKPEQFTDYTSPLAIMVGRAIGASPMKLDNILRSTNSGRDIARLSSLIDDELFNKGTSKPTAQRADWFGIGRFFPRTDRGDAQQLQDFHDFEVYAKGFHQVFTAAGKPNVLADPENTEGLTDQQKAILKRNPQWAQVPNMVITGAEALGKLFTKMQTIRTAVMDLPDKDVQAKAEALAATFGFQMDFTGRAAADIKRDMIDGINHEMIVRASLFNKIVQTYTKAGLVQDWNRPATNQDLFAPYTQRIFTGTEAPETVGHDDAGQPMQPLPLPDPAMREALNARYQGSTLQGVADSMRGQFGIEPRVSVKSNFGTEPSRTDRMADGSYEILLHPSRNEPWAVHHEMRHVLEDMGGAPATPHDNTALTQQGLQLDPVVSAGLQQLAKRPYREGRMFWDMAQQLKQGQDISEWARNAVLTPEEGRQVGVLAALDDRTGVLNMLNTPELVQAAQNVPEGDQPAFEALMHRHRGRMKRLPGQLRSAGARIYRRIVHH